MITIEQLATDCANHYLGRIEGHTDHFETLRKVFLKGYEQAGGDYAIGYANGQFNGIKDGHNKGYHAGYLHGKEEGIKQGSKDALVYRWVSTKQRPPEHRQKIIGYDDGANDIFLGIWVQDGPVPIDGYIIEGKMTHWMPIPSLPS